MQLTTAQLTMLVTVVTMLVNVFLSYSGITHTVSCTLATIVHQTAFALITH